MPSYEDELIRRSRELQRLATVRRRLKRQLKKVDVDIKAARKVLMAVKQASEGRRPDAAPSRLHAGVTAVGTLHSELPKPKGKANKGERHLSSCQLLDGVWFCAADCEHHVIVDADLGLAVAK